MMWGVTETRTSPVMVALSQGNIDGAKNLIRNNPELAAQRIKWVDGFSTIMHLVCVYAAAETVQALVEVTPDYLCLLLTDDQRRTLLHIAAGEGREEVVGVLITACPRSIQQLTSLAETALHVALKKGHWGCFRVLMEQLQNLNPQWMELLNRQDFEGNTLLHTAILHKQVEIVKLLVSCEHRNGDCVVDVNSMNNLGLTALDLHYRQMYDENDREICDILHEASVKKGQSSNNCSQSDSEKMMMQESMKLMRKSLLLAWLIFVASAAYQSLFNLIDLYPAEQTVEILTISFEDIIRSPNQLPEVFYAIMTNTLAFLVSLFAIFRTFWSMATSKWSLCYHAAPLLVGAAILVNCGLAAKKTMPNFLVTIGAHQIPSFWAMWCLFDFPLIFLGVAASLMVKLIYL
ncbi:ankyrin repeat-containing protein BDA1-like [Cornus florida]|uniref:ankyrin repeat-containing protein BDA1-like n=1 Tax=Cornus florida TaxID=4283 RepID=UPI0028A20A97|nr:ankyrin repeat-containing protein BDA1-like [Cornus florida]